MPTSPRILVVGSSNTDFVVKAPRLPVAGETVLGSEFVTARGGKGANQAVAATRLGANVTFVARLGADRLGNEALAAYRAEGIDVTHISRDPAAASGVALIVVGEGGENLIAAAPGANHTLRPEHVEAAQAAFAGADIVLLQLEMPLDTVAAAMRLARRHGVRTILNPAPAAAIPDEILAGADILTPNETELAFFAGRRHGSIPECGRAWRAALGLREVVVTLGGEGALIVGQIAAEDSQVPAFPVSVVDTTGAGDAFNAGLAVALARGENLPAAVRYANAVGGLKTTRLGAQASPLANEVEALLKARAGHG